MRVWLLLAGEYASARWSLGEQDVVIAVDGGMRHAARLGVTPQRWIGDFDSADAALMHQYSDVPKQRHPTHKDATDFELALAVVKRDYPQTGALSIIGGVGDEYDHSFANLWVLPRFGLPALLWGDAQQTIYLPAQCLLSAELAPESTVSVFALTPLRDMVYDGLAWQAPHNGLEPFSALASRNRNTNANVRIQWGEGDGLVFLPSTTRRLMIQRNGCI